MLSVVVDIDDTLVDTDNRRWTVWCKVLNREIPLEAVESLGSRQILKKFAFGSKEIWRKYWTTLLCWEEAGNNILELDKPIPFASEVLQKWREEYKIIYLTGRSENMKKLTIDELKRFNFPVSNIDLVMLSLQSWEKYFTSKMSPIKLRTHLFSSIVKRYRVVRVVDDYPIFFPIYREFKVPDRIGLLRGKRFRQQDYFNKGAIRVTTWGELLKELP